MAKKCGAIKVSDYVLRIGGKRIRKATKVTMGGKTVRFTEKMGKKEAVKQASKQLKCHPEYF